MSNSRTGLLHPAIGCRGQDPKGRAAEAVPPAAPSDGHGGGRTEGGPEKVATTTEDLRRRPPLHRFGTGANSGSVGWHPGRSKPPDRARTPERPTRNTLNTPNPMARPSPPRKRDIPRGARTGHRLPDLDTIPGGLSAAGIVAADPRQAATSLPTAPPKASRQPLGAAPGVQSSDPTPVRGHCPVGVSKAL